jgi:hypothetical protein
LSGEYRKVVKSFIEVLSNSLSKKLELYKKIFSDVILW